MFKRNDGYALSYVLVVLMVLAIIATAVMAPPLRNLQLQQASIERMQEKYIAQGMVEQIVAQFEHTDSRILPETICTSDPNSNPIIIYEGNLYIITAKSNTCILTANIKLTEHTKQGSEGEDPQFDFYTVSYDSYSISYNTEVGS